MAPTPDSVHALIVDDDRAIQRLLADVLTKEGFWVTVERDGDWALKTFEKKKFDVVLLDLLLPALNGYEVAKRMLELPRGSRTPIIMLSGVYKTPSQQKDAVEKYGAFAFIEKPFKLNSLIETLRAALGERYPRHLEPLEREETTQPDGYADPRAREEAGEVEKVSNSVSSFQSIRGDFTHKNFPEVLAEVQRWKGTGALLLRRDKVKKIVYFRDGIPQSLKSNLLSECLGRVMVRERMISEDECEESLRRMKASGRQQGTVLVEMGCISPHNLSYALNLQLRSKLLEVFTWEAGQYQFSPKVTPPPETVRLEMSPAAIIYEGIKRNFDTWRMHKVLGGRDQQYLIRSDNPLFAFQDMGLGEEELNLLNAADGGRTLQDLRDLHQLPTLDTDRFVYALLCAQMAELDTTRLADSARMPLPGTGEEVPWDEEPEAASAPPPMPPPRNKPPPLAPLVTTSQILAPPPVVAPGANVYQPLLPEISYVHSALPDAESEVREKLLEKLTALQKKDYFELLGVARDATVEIIKRAYFTLAREFHPDKHANSASTEVRLLANQVYGLITLAHDTLVSPEERKRYRVQLTAGSVRREIPPDVTRMLSAEHAFRAGEDLLRGGRFAEAHALFENAVKEYGEEGEFHAFLGWSLFQARPKDPQAAEASLAALTRAVELNPTYDKSYLFSGYVYKALGRPDKAERQFEKCIECNPDNREALHELSLLTWAARLTSKTKNKR